MSAQRRARAALAAAAAQVEGFFLEPPDDAGPGSSALGSERARPPLTLVPESEPPAVAEAHIEAPAGEGSAPAPPAPPAPPAGPSLRPVVVVFGLARSCGATVVARALAAELAGRDEAGAAAVASAGAVAGLPLATAAAGRLADALRDVPGARTAAVGRLCLVAGAKPAALAGTARHFAPLVIDAGGMAVTDEATDEADHAMLVTAPGVEPTLTRVAGGCVRAGGIEPIVVANRAQSDSTAPLDSFALPDSRMGAQLALGGRRARGDLGRAIAVLADLCEERA